MRLDSEKILVTGGAGFLGGLIAQELIKMKCEVHVIDNFTVGKPSSVPNGVEKVFEGNVNANTLEKVDDDYAYIFHFAAPCTILMFDKDPIALYNNALESAISIREFAVKKHIPTLVYASSATYYGKNSSNWFNSLTKETFEKTSDPVLQSCTAPSLACMCNSFSHHKIYTYMEDMLPTPANIYGATKVAEESLDTVYVGPRYIGLRIFPVFGSREWLKGDVASIQYKILYGILNDKPVEIWGDGRQKRDYLYQDDFADVVISLVEREGNGPYNIGSGMSMSHNQIVEVATNYLNSDWKPTYVTNPYYDSYLDTLICDNRKLVDVIGEYEFTSPSDGLCKMIEDMMIDGKN